MKSFDIGEDMVEIVKNTKEGEWRNFIKNYNSTSIFHTPEWKYFLEKTFNYKPFYLFSQDECGNMNGLLPLFYVKSKLTGNRLCSVPFSHICGSIGSDDSRCNLTDEAINIYKKSNADYLEIRDLVNSKGFHSQNSFSTYILELSPNVEKIWCKLEKKSSRWAVTKSKKMGVEVSSSKRIEDLKEFYEMNCITKKDIGVPCHSWKFFKNMFELLNEHISLYIAKHNNEIIAGGIFNYFNDYVNYAYGAASPNHLKFHPYNAFIWQSIEDSCVNGYKYFDFGRTSYDNKGLIAFKTNWGTIEKKLYYSRHPDISKTIVENREGIRYSYGKKVIQKTPMSVYKKFSSLTFQHFG